MNLVTRGPGVSLLVASRLLQSSQNQLREQASLHPATSLLAIAGSAQRGCVHLVLRGGNRPYRDVHACALILASEPGRVSLCLAGPSLAGSHQGRWSPGSSATKAPQAYAATQ